MLLRVVHNVWVHCYPRLHHHSKSLSPNAAFREFLNRAEVDAVIAQMSLTRSPVRNQALAILLFCQALQPIELCWLRWCDLNFAEKILLVTRNRTKTARCQSQQIVINLQPLCPTEIEVLQQLYQQRSTDWIFASERKQRLSERSLHHIIRQAGELASLTNERTSLHVTALRLLLPSSPATKPPGVSRAGMLSAVELASDEHSLL